MADFFGELVIGLIQLIFEVMFATCHTQRGCMLSLLTFFALVSTIACFIAACTLAEGPVAGALGTLAVVNGILFLILGTGMIWSKCVDEPKK